MNRLISADLIPKDEVVPGVGVLVVAAPCEVREPTVVEGPMVTWTEV